MVRARVISLLLGILISTAVTLGCGPSNCAYLGRPAPGVCGDAWTCGHDTYAVACPDGGPDCSANADCNWQLPGASR